MEDWAQEVKFAPKNGLSVIKKRNIVMVDYNDYLRIIKLFIGRVLMRDIAFARGLTIARKPIQ
jgi:hypothetical protein